MTISFAFLDLPRHSRGRKTRAEHRILPHTPAKHVAYCIASSSTPRPWSSRIFASDPLTFESWGDLGSENLGRRSKLVEAHFRIGRLHRDLEQLLKPWLPVIYLL